MPERSKLILASSSPRRLELLKNIGFTPDEVIPADIDETPHKAEKPRIYTERIAREKAEKIAAQNKGAFIIAADTTAAVGTRILGKAENAEEAKRIIKLMSGRQHRVYTSVAVVNPAGELRIKNVVTFVKFKNITEYELEQYIATNSWQGKAGAYGLQEDPGAFVVRINGSFSSVIGLPLYETKSLLLGLGFKQ